MSDVGEAIRIDPKDVQALTTRANYLAERKNYERALVDVDEALRHDPKNTELVWMRADLLVSTGDWKKLLADPNMRIELHLEDVPAAVTCICEFMTTGYLVKALLDLDQVLAIEPNNENANSANAANQAAISQEGGGSPARRAGEFTVAFRGVAQIGALGRTP